MKILFHPHALDRMKERGASEDEVISTIEQGESFAAKYGRTAFRRNFVFDSQWMGRQYNIKQVEAYAVKENNDWPVLTGITKYF